MKKFFSGFLVLCLSLALLTACGKDGQTGKTVAAGGLTFAKSYSEVYSALTDAQKAIADRDKSLNMTDGASDDPESGGKGDGEGEGTFYSGTNVQVAGVDEGDIVKVAVIGKPNVGKSSLVNKILGEERVIVSNVAGTTRDAIDSYFENDQGRFVFIDTAGIRRKSKVEEDIEKYSVLRATMAIERSDVCLILIDANEGVTEQDTKVAGLAHEAGKACIIVVNKWDTVEKDTNTMDEKTAEIRRDLSYMTYAPVVFISALTGQRVDKLFDMIVAVSNQNSMRITTGMLNNILEDATARVQPPTDKGRRLKIYYMTQASTKPPTFVIFVNRADLFHFSYQRYIENQIRSTFGLTGTPVRFVVRERARDEK